MSYYYNPNKGKVATIVAIILGVLLAASITLGLGNYFGGWFESDETEVDQGIESVEDSTSVTEDSGSDLVVDDSTSGESVSE